MASEVEKQLLGKKSDSNLFLRKSYVVIWKEGCCIDGDVRRLKGRKYEKKIKRRIGKEEWIQRLLIIGMILAF